MTEAETAAASAAVEAAEAEIAGRVAHMSDAELVSVLLSHHRDAQARRRQAEFCRERLLDVLLESCAGAARDVAPADHSTWADVSSAYPSFHPFTAGHSGTVTSARCVSAIEVEEVSWHGGNGGGDHAYQHALYPPSPSALQSPQQKKQAAEKPRHSHLGSGGMPPKLRRRKEKGGGPSWGPRPHSPPRKRAGSTGSAAARAAAAAQLQAHCDSC
eukprot:Rhum_TRINITY_DN26037_c0_g1::Rhum_TRINITY_DN26037_c0_g1_i1::g.183143::m.183143